MSGCWYLIADGFKFLIRDQGAKFTAFDAVLAVAGAGARANAIAERWIASAHRECVPAPDAPGHRQTVPGAGTR
jgi:hypothetical protein